MAGGQRKEACRNFQRGSCAYGGRCKFLHSTPPQHSKPTFSSAPQQQHTPNPFGFGIQQQPTSKPFENKWSRFTQTNNVVSQPSTQPLTPPPNHKCTDPHSCKRLISEDYQHERPLWSLTCYAHNKSAPCDIIGDISYEELRAAAYDDASHGVNFNSIVERERNLLNAKLQEFESLIRNPYVLKHSPITNQSSFPGLGSPTVLPLTTANVIPPSVSSFSQPTGSFNTGFGTMPGQQIPVQAFSHPHSGLGTNKLSFGNSGAVGVQYPSQQLGNHVSGSANNMDHKTSFLPPVSSQIANSGSGQSPLFPNFSNSASTAVESRPRENGAGDNTIWLAEWKRGEVPEEAPPDIYIS